MRDRREAAIDAAAVDGVDLHADWIARIVGLRLGRTGQRRKRDGRERQDAAGQHTDREAAAMIDGMILHRAAPQYLGSRPGFKRYDRKTPARDGEVIIDENADLDLDAQIRSGATSP